MDNSDGSYMVNIVPAAVAVLSGTPHRTNKETPTDTEGLTKLFCACQ